MKQLLDDIFDEELTAKGFAQGGAKLLVLIVVVISFAIYIGDILFGKSSLEVLLSLQEKTKIYKEKNSNLKKENAKLQKKYFELLQLQP